MSQKDLEPITALQRMIGLLIGSGAFTYGSIAAAVREADPQEYGDQKDSEKALTEHLRRVHRGEINRSRPIFGLYRVFHTEIGFDYVSEWNLTTHDAMERSFLIGDMLNVRLLGRQVESVPLEEQEDLADGAFLWLLRARVHQLIDGNLEEAMEAFEMAERGFAKVLDYYGSVEGGDSAPYLRYQKLVAMENQLNVGYRLSQGSQEGEAAYRELVKRQLAKGLVDEIKWAIEEIAPDARRAYLLAEALASVGEYATEGAAEALLTAIMIDPRLVHFDISPFTGEEPVDQSRFMEPVVRLLEDQNLDLLASLRQLAPRDTVPAIERARMSREAIKLRDAICTMNEGVSR